MHFINVNIGILIMIKTLLFGLLTGFTSKYSLDHKIFPLFSFFMNTFILPPLLGSTATVQSDLKT